MEEATKRLTDALTDPASGASAESIAEIRAQMERPEVAAAVYRHLTERDLSTYDPSKIAQLPPNQAEWMHKHFPSTSTSMYLRATFIGTLNPNGIGMNIKRLLLNDARVLSLHDVGSPALKIFADKSTEITNPFIYGKMHAVFLKADDKCTKIDLCDLFEWCKCSVVDDKHATVYENMSIRFMETPFGRVCLAVHVLQNADECKVNIRNGDKTVQIRIKNGPTVIGIGLHTPNYCKLCRKPRSDTTKLKECSRCLTFGIKVFYCSRACQLLDYPKHRHVCTYDWSASDWRENAPSFCRE